MHKSAEDVIAEIFAAVRADSDASALEIPLHDLWKADRWVAEQVTRAAEEAHKSK